MGAMDEDLEADLSDPPPPHRLTLSEVGELAADPPAHGFTTQALAREVLALRALVEAAREVLAEWEQEEWDIDTAEALAAFRAALAGPVGAEEPQP